MSNKSSFESRILDYYTNSPFEKVDIIHGLVKEIFRRRAKIDQIDESKRVLITSTTKPKRKRRTKAQMEASATTPAQTATSA